MRTAVPCFRTGRCRRFSFWGGGGGGGIVPRLLHFLRRGCGFGAGRRLPGERSALPFPLRQPSRQGGRDGAEVQGGGHPCALQFERLALQFKRLAFRFKLSALQLHPLPFKVRWQSFRCGPSSFPLFRSKGGSVRVALRLCFRRTPCRQGKIPLRKGETTLSARGRLPPGRRDAAGTGQGAVLPQSPAGESGVAGSGRGSPLLCRRYSMTTTSDCRSGAQS